MKILNIYSFRIQTRDSDSDDDDGNEDEESYNCYLFGFGPPGRKKKKEPKTELTHRILFGKQPESNDSTDVDVSDSDDYAYRLPPLVGDDDVKDETDKDGEKKFSPL